MKKLKVGLIGYGSGGRIFHEPLINSVEGFELQEHCLKQSELPVDRPDWGKEPESIWGRLNTDIEGVHFCGKIESEHGDYQMVYKNLHDAICGSGMLHITPEQARDTIRLIELAQKSSEMKCWISVN